ncbi:MAG: glycosyltransferase [Flavobacteriales bacterium]|nr:glycosyltransferase [Flavobacteriales bacterium]MCW8913425.1 glycosyltransferase [Flavobacteriales bacterium]MCW8938511.1 glycosyltransferase [Flavobacteriales bacterium]MCW8940135.1 glycosyltransferase [Flavobacteriales bacterium]MCW8967470.1 glycosyltransferase [Flavobacteriales bacterium]
MISIIMPVKNTSLYLSECLNSIINQTEKNWELIAVNDHSTDNSKEILASFANQDNRIKVWDNTGNGIIDALQLAYSKSSGTFITRMDSDDIMALEKLSSLKNQLLQYGKKHITIGLVNYFSDLPLGDGYTRYEEWLNSLTKTGTNFTDIYKECVIASPCWMVYREDFESCGAFNSSIYPEDYDLAFRFYKNKLKCIPSTKVLHYWRDYPERTSRNDENYADSSFINLKTHHFINIDYKQQPLILWGAGKKGKKVAELLLNANIPFIWICDNPKKIGKEIYGQQMIDYKNIENFNLYQSIITIANPIVQQEVKTLLTKQNLTLGKDFFFFC